MTCKYFFILLVVLNSAIVQINSQPVYWLVNNKMLLFRQQGGQDHVDTRIKLVNLTLLTKELYWPIAVLVIGQPVLYQNQHFQKISKTEIVLYLFTRLYIYIYIYILYIYIYIYIYLLYIYIYMARPLMILSQTV